MSDDPKDIINWRRWSDKITLSGQPTEQQLSEIAALGVTHVINLGPHWNKGALEDEAASVADAGMEYIYIPVDFDAPTQADFDAFEKALDALADTKVHVHCIYNARVSAFMYKRAKLRDERAKEAFELMDGIWRPGAVWAQLISIEPTANGKNQYLGYDY